VPVTVPLLAKEPAALAALRDVEVLYTDLDGTLLGKGGSVFTDVDGTPSLVVAEAIAELNAAGFTIVPCSGRNRLQLSEITRLLGWRGFLAELGCVIVPDRGAEPLYFIGDWTGEEFEPGETPYEAIERVGAVEALREAFPGRIEYHDPHHLDREVTHVLRGNVDAAAAQRVMDALPIPVAIADNGIIHPPATTLVGVGEVHAYHLMPKGVRKPRGIRFDLDRRMLQPAQAMSAGDSTSDVAMAEATAMVVLVANALDDPAVLRAAAAHENVYATAGRGGAGWAELAELWMAARSG